MMSVLDLPVFTALKQKMLWHQTRQTLLAENVANAETPGYRGRDLTPFDFGAHLREVQMSGMATTATDPRHISIASEAGDGFGARTVNAFEVTPNGNSVTLEDEMMKVTANQLDYQAATTLYARSLKLIRTALGRA
jgi:flagellar basal-body rod protein FlgB